MYNANPSRESSITVAVRVRPFTPGETSHLVKPTTDAPFLGDGSLSAPARARSTLERRAAPRGLRKIVNVVDDRMLIFDPPESNPLQRMQRNAFPDNKSARIREYRFVFDRLFDEDAAQSDVYETTTKPLLDSVLDGFNATVFAYGATGCGKTHTISGTPDAPGIIFLTMRELFARIDARRDTQLVEVSLSYLEIYNETIRDLLNPDEKKLLSLREDVNKRISVTNLSVHAPQTVDEVMHMIMVGNENRTSSPTEANATSSRSHAVLQINVAQRARTADLNEEHVFATLSIIDLAGSERALATQNRGQRLHEGANINKSLLALGNCINALCDPRRRNHIPYRDSKLTRLLKFSLGGNCKTVMIVCVSPLSHHYDETLNTLKYADRAKEIKTKVQRNTHNLDRHVGSYLKMITEQKQEIAELRAREAAVTAQACVQAQTRTQKILAALNDGLETLRASLGKQKPRRAQILVKRKLLILQKIETEEFLNEFDKVFDSVDLISCEGLIEGITNVKHFSETLYSKLMMQIAELEELYAAELDSDLILRNSSQQMLSKLVEMDGWTEDHTTLFQAHVQLLGTSVERDVLFKSSVMFDQLVVQLKPFRFVSSLLINLLASNMDIVMQQANGTNDDGMLRQQDVVERLETAVHEYNNRWPVPSISTRPWRVQSTHPAPSSRRRPLPAKKVRWEVPSANDSDVSMDEDRAKDESFDTSGHMDISPAVKLSDELPLEIRKRRSLTSRPLKSAGKKGVRVEKSAGSRSPSPSRTNRKLDLGEFPDGPLPVSVANTS
ncbi:hypothetical protein BABINDRAFT_171951 [Babjeviella inositovora NRRL Y-12698]|uniref:Kinesin-like protein n=1 Tax=Babjeviella inositovora NRRL Y-12698 TaxID=984486 RepID=A0A1E3QNH8_9ASCO|nr:uncharacterized protein BABINDRAFT_171951 [Babjeviella inositovora NRRL Y-12698]ODQ79190.1 hypothetical protein BABINDRAFT_171951 [Babjeviella inositovora NRRL Y-12698]